MNVFSVDHVVSMEFPFSGGYSSVSYCQGVFPYARWAPVGLVGVILECASRASVVPRVRVPGWLSS